MSGTKTDPIIFSSSSEEETAEDIEDLRRARGVKLRPMVRHRHKRRSKRARTGGYRVTHSEDQQKQLAEQQNERLQSSLEIAPSITAPGQSYDAFLELRASEHSYDAFLSLPHP